MARRTWQQARAEPMASPSGRACEVSTNRSRCPICRRTSSISLCRFSTGFLAGLAPFSRPPQQFLYPRLLALRTIEPEKQFRGTPQALAVGEFAPDVSLGCVETFQAALRLIIIALDIHQNLRTTAIFRQVHARHAD